MDLATENTVHLRPDLSCREFHGLWGWPSAKYVWKYILNSIKTAFKNSTTCQPSIQLHISDRKANKILIMQFFETSSDFTDVTLAVDDIHVCKHFQTGHCKFGVNCRKRHISENCLNVDCLDKTCLKRHPKQCKYFSQIGSCRFGEECSYKHTLPSSHEHFSSQIQALEGRIGDMFKAIKALED